MLVGEGNVWVGDGMGTYFFPAGAFPEIVFEALDVDFLCDARVLDVFWSEASIQSD